MEMDCPTCKKPGNLIRIPRLDKFTCKNPLCDKYNQEQKKEAHSKGPYRGGSRR